MRGDAAGNLKDMVLRHRSCLNQPLYCISEIRATEQVAIINPLKTFRVNSCNSWANKNLVTISLKCPFTHKSRQIYIRFRAYRFIFTPFCSNFAIKQEY